MENPQCFQSRMWHIYIYICHIQNVWHIYIYICHTWCSNILWKITNVFLKKIGQNIWKIPNVFNFGCGIYIYIYMPHLRSQICISWTGCPADRQNSTLGLKYRGLLIIRSALDFDLKRVGGLRNESLLAAASDFDLGLSNILLDCHCSTQSYESKMSLLYITEP